MSIIVRGCQLTHRQKTVQLPWDQHELHHYHQITCSSPGQTPFRKVFRADAFPLLYKYDISEPMRCLVTEGTWQWGSCMQIWCTGCISPIHHNSHQIVLHNPSVNLEIRCAWHSPIYCIRNTDFLWSIFPVTIFYSLSLMLDKEWECLASSFNVQCLFCRAFLHLASSPSMCFGPLSFSLSPCCFSG